MRDLRYGDVVRSTLTGTVLFLGSGIDEIGEYVAVVHLSPRPGIDTLDVERLHPSHLGIFDLIEDGP